MQETIKTESAEVEVLANGEAISMCIKNTEYDKTACAWLTIGDALMVIDALICAMYEHDGYIFTLDEEWGE